MIKNKGGRPFGSTTRPQLRDFISKEDVKKIINEAKKKAKEGDTTMLRFILEQIFGRAIQPIGTEDGKPLIVKFDIAFITAPKNNSKKPS